MMLLRPACLLLFALLASAAAACHHGDGADADPGSTQLAGPSLAQRLREHVDRLCANGQRSVEHVESLRAARDYVASDMRASGLEPREVSYSYDGHEVANIVADLPPRGADPTSQGAELPLVILGAHYDSIGPGADDNASGVAVLLELASELSAHELPARVQLVAFVNEEPPCFQADCMGSLVYAKTLQQAGVPVHLMVSIESVGYWSDEPDSQQYPAPLDLMYPSTGDFLGVVSTLGYATLVDEFADALRQVGSLPVEAAALPSALPGVGWSDHWSFIESGYPALMITDTALFRNPNYHEATDTPRTLDYERMALVVEALRDSLPLVVATR
jgi:hypothetical protein